MSRKSAHKVVYCVFDVIYKDGQSIAARPLTEHKTVLNSLELNHRSELFGMDYPEKAIPHYKDALDKAREIDMSRLIGSSLYNLGLCSFAEEAYEKAAEYFKEGD